MCGILVQTGQREIEEESFRKALDSMSHRGPDNGNVWHSGDASIFLGHRRLSIVDLSSAGQQPMENEDKSLHLVCNGEIYNYTVLRKELEGLGHAFRSSCDSEVILHAYEQWGDACVERLFGMFAFAIWDEARQKLFAARDRVGIKPLCYAELNGTLILASEAGPIRMLLGNKTRPNPLALAYIMTLGYIPAPFCIWDKIRKVKPGHFLNWTQTRGVCEKKYWEPPRHVAVEAGEEDLRTLLHCVLEEHLLSDVPLALFLSGGLDSSGLAAALKEIDRPLQTITMGFPKYEKDESALGAAMAKHIGFPNKIIQVQTEDAKDLAQMVASSFDEPQGYSALLPMYEISRIASKDYRVVLAGDGGDEVFGGYNWYKNLEGPFGTRTRTVLRGNASSEQHAFAANEFANASVLHRHAWRLFPRFLPEEAQQILAPSGVQFGDEEMLAPLRLNFEEEMPLRRALQRVDLMSFCSDSILPKVDRASMSQSLELRVPFLDHRMIEWALPQPVSDREETEGKPWLRDYLKCRAPTEVLNHPKQGFSLPVLDKFDWEGAIEVIGDSYWAKSGLWSPAWKDMLAPGYAFRNGRIWTLYMLSLWADKWMERN
ncbi:MAG: asparagine synthase (glutamine-hydrolyzing) [Lentisphaerae bacterium GWF2_52_8]|nr:MAG: asparagine synthase (glutamine-hydrolyzing) [Lentisphaerae bacterium GWF2_52_8]